MKKFCNKITKQQWRVTVPNINTNIFRKTPFRESPEKSPTAKEPKRISSGSYDFQTAEREFQTSNGVPSCALVDSETSDTDTEDDFEDAHTVSEKRNEVDNSAENPESELYADVASSANSDNLLNNNTKFECDVPKICFSFFECRANDDQYETVNVKKHKSELKIKLASPENFDVDTSSERLFDVSDDKCSTPNNMYVNEDMIARMSPIEEYEIPAEVVMLKETKQIDLYLTKNLDDLAFKCGSDPNISLRPIQEEENEDDGLYKVPKPIRRHRLSQSLRDFSEAKPISVETSIEHISCSQVLIQRNKADAEVHSAQTSENMDYCKTRSKFPAKLRRVTLLRRPKNKYTWDSLKAKVNNMISEHSDKDKEKLSNNLEEMYRSSKDKCKRVLKQTGKIFKMKKDQENVDPNSDTSSQIIKNDAFFANIKSVDGDKTEFNCNGSDLSECCDRKVLLASNGADLDREIDFNTLKSAFRKSKFLSNEGQNGFDDLRRYVKQNGDFCKELSTILQERSEAEIQYAKNLSKLSNKLSRACREGVGVLNEAWRAVAFELESRAEGHRSMGAAILEDAAKPLRTLTENQHRSRKQAEATVDKAARCLSDWRSAEAKGKKHSHTCARENEKLQDAMLENRLSRSTSLIHLAHIHKTSSDKENAKLEGKKRKAEDAVKKADIEYYTLCVRAERARLEWESAVVRGASTFQSLEEDRLNNLKSILVAYLDHTNDLGPKLIEATDRLRVPVNDAEPSQDLSTFITLRHSSQQISEQLLPDFYCEHITLAMNRERRKQALVKLVHLIKQDIERERKSKNGLENLSRAIKQTPNFGAEDSNQSVTEKLYHMKSMLTYLEGARYKVQSALAELDSRPRTGHPLAPHITITRDKSGLQQSVLKVPQWLKDQWCEPEKSPVSEKSVKSDTIYPELPDPDPDWNDRGTADGNSNQPDSDFDEFSSQGSSAGGLCTDDSPVQPIAQCKALYAYTPNLSDELPLHPGDILSVYRQQDDGWWLGECNGSVGIFPATYVETISNNTFKC